MPEVRPPEDYKFGGSDYPVSGKGKTKGFKGEQIDVPEMKNRGGVRKSRKRYDICLDKIPDQGSDPEDILIQAEEQGEKGEDRSPIRIKSAELLDDKNLDDNVLNEDEEIIEGEQEPLTQSMRGSAKLKSGERWGEGRSENRKFGMKRNRGKDPKYKDRRPR